MDDATRRPVFVRAATKDEVRHGTASGSDSVFATDEQLEYFVTEALEAYAKVTCLPAPRIRRLHYVATLVSGLAIDVHIGDVRFRLVLTEIRR